MDSKKRLEDAVSRFVKEERLLTEGCAVAAGVSGGADSLCMLLCLKKLYGDSHSICAVHINHGLRDEAGDDEAYVKRICDERDIPFISFSVDVEARMNEDGISCEEAGRRLRYEAFDKAAQMIREGSFKGIKIPVKEVRIAVAHTMNDNAETMLLNLFRGTGLKGLSGIPARRDDVIRPLLCIGREDTEDYLKALGLPFCLDKTNKEDDFTRNRIRHKLLPAARECINTKAVEHMGITAKALRSAEDFALSETEKAFLDCCEVKVQGLFMDRKKFLCLHPYIQDRVILKAMTVTCGKARDLSAVHIAALKGLFDKGRGRRLDLPYFITAKRQDGYVVLCVEKDKKLGKNKPVSGKAKDF